MTTQVSVDTDEKLALIAHLMRRVGVGARQDRLESLATESYEDLRFELGFYSSFNEMRQAQYRKMGIVTDLSQIQNIIDSGKPTFIEGWSESCVYCKMGEVALKKLKVEHSNQVNFVIVDVSNRYLEDVTETLRYFQISSTPTYIILDKNGEETYRSVGYAAEGEKLSKILYENY